MSLIQTQMPLFKSSHNDTAVQHREPTPPRKGLFGTGGTRDDSPPPAPTRSGGFLSRDRDNTPPPQTTTSSGGGLFGHSKRKSTGTYSDDSSSGSGFLSFGKKKHGLDQDPTLLAARQKVAEAEMAEREADRALIEARQSVRGAKEHIKLLEREAIDE